MNRPNRPQPFSSLLLVLVAVSVATFAQAVESFSLKWDQTQLSYETEIGQERVEAQFAFVNSSVHTVTVTNTSASCGCTVPSLDKTVYAPGESGVLKAIFTIGSRQGHQHKTISVETQADGKPETYELTLDVEIPVPVTLKPRVRFWNVGDKTTTQDIEIAMNEKFPLIINGVKAKPGDESDAFTYDIETKVEGRSYTLHITPKSMAEKARGVFYLTASNDTKGVLANSPIYVYVR